MFLGSLLTGLLNDNIKMEIKPCLQNTQVEDEELFEKLNAAVSNETERMQKLGSRHDQLRNRTPTQLVVQLATHDDSHASVEGKTPKNPPKVNLLTEVRELKAELAAIREGMEQQSRASPHPQYNPVEQGRVRTRGCWNCQRKEEVSVATIVSTVVMSATSVTNAEGAITQQAPRETDKGCPTGTMSSPPDS